MIFSAVGLPHNKVSKSSGIVSWLAGTCVAIGLLTLIVTLQKNLDRNINTQLIKIEELAQLPSGEYLKPSMLGYQHLGADILWLRMLQVLGKKRNAGGDYEWIYHAIDVITTLDPQYAYPYYVGGVVLTNLANRVDLSNRLLEKGHRENPGEWNLSFLLGYNHYFLLGDAAKGAQYIERAARTSGAPDFLAGLATRMYAEAGNPDVALQFLEALWKENHDLVLRENLETRAKEVLIERDLRTLQRAVARYQKTQRRFPVSLTDLVSGGYLERIPEEPFGGSYVVDSRTGYVTSSTHPNRLKVFRLDLEAGV